MCRRIWSIISVGVWWSSGPSSPALPYRCWLRPGIGGTPLLRCLAVHRKIRQIRSRSTSGTWWSDCRSPLGGMPVLSSSVSSTDSWRAIISIASVTGTLVNKLTMSKLTSFSSPSRVVSRAFLAKSAEFLM